MGKCILGGHCGGESEDFKLILSLNLNWAQYVYGTLPKPLCEYKELFIISELQTSASSDVCPVIYFGSIYKVSSPLYFPCLIATPTTESLVKGSCILKITKLSDEGVFHLVGESPDYIGSAFVVNKLLAPSLLSNQYFGVSNPGGSTTYNGPVRVYAR
jgi:hypothetical protein